MELKPLEVVLQTFGQTRFHPESRLFTWHPRGTLDDSLADDILAIVETEECYIDYPFHRYADFSQLTSVSLHVGHVFELADRRRQASHHVKSAFFADTAVGLGIARMYESLMAGAAIQVRSFSDRDDAAEWLEVPPELLLPV